MKDRLADILKVDFPPVYERSWMDDYSGDFFSRIVQRAAYQRGLELLQPLPVRVLRTVWRRARRNLSTWTTRDGS